MNSHNLKKRRPYGHEDPPAVPVAQGPLFSASATVAAPDHFSSQELQILERASAILRCPFPQLLELNRVPYQQHSSVSPRTHTASHKRPRLDTDISPMHSHQKPPHSGHDASDHRRRPEGANNSLFGVDGSRIVEYLANISVCSPCTSCEPQGYAGIPATAPYAYAQTRPMFEHKPSSSHSQPGPMHSQAAGAFTYDDTVVGQPVMPNYPALQPDRPMAVQPNTSGEGMVYPETVPVQRYPGRTEMQQSSPTSTNSHVTGSQSYTTPLNSPEEPSRCYSAAQGILDSEAGGAQIPSQSRDLDIVRTNQRPPPARRGPFRTNVEREQTAETRRIGSCIRCRMQRIRCEANPENKSGTCLTCQRVSNVKIWRMPCLRYKITDVKLFKPGQVKGHEWTARWVEGIADDISNWESTEIKTIEVTEGYTDQPVRLRVRKFKPQEGDKLKRYWVYNGERREADIPPYAIVNLDEAKGAYSSYINQELPKCCKNVLSGKEALLTATYVAAIRAAREPGVDEKERDLLRKALQLWMAIRLTTKSTIIVGKETLGIEPMDETSPLRGCIPLPPVMGAQIELVLIHQIQSSLRRDLLETLQSMTQANKHQTWYTTYLITFILLHNVALLCQHDAGYARKHGLPVGQPLLDDTRFAREDMVREYQMGANILLAYFHYCNKGIYPFSAQCKDSDLTTLAELDETKTKFVKLTRSNVERHKNSWTKMRQSNDHENDFYYISQLFEENWVPQGAI
ncbi:Uu.00g038490.m01.CDS01 [Anthostomella pinea]|uniref:Uu.00g038490.m01.CDS01 n=1 Tax=Anthostomella pinea TaxID=933095 RepID=A0AAI8VAV4_9PEZI|nr:Uu.00g038490.m01.CDS01 [Anthostomella pinea]